MRTWANMRFGNEKELEFVVMATIDDIEANAEYIAEADYLHEVPSGTNNNNFANVALIVQVAEEHQCDAVWPGWGHASENHELPQALLKASRPIAWIGPKPLSMLALGDKIGSTIIAQSCGVPCVPWSGSDVKLPSGIDSLDELPADLLEAACVKSADDVKRVCAKIGFPVMVKASEGGGGKGIRKVLSEADIPDAYRQVVNEVKGSPVFVMKMVSRCRHLEVQLFADEHGHCVSLGTRDCSIQRRSQKIIEEGNVVAAPASVVKLMEDSAVRLATKVGYTNAGTAEFLYDAETQEVYFCEVNARLQVEHVVTEVVDDLNLPAAQLQVAMGIPLKKISDVSRFLKSREDNTLPSRHCVACRITAEHAEEGFRPTSGAVHEISFRSSAKVWGYFCIGSPGRIHAFADSQFGHLFSVGDTRAEAIDSMLAALKSLVIRGEIRTNVEALMTILHSEDFRNLRTWTTWLEESIGFTTPLLSRRVPHSTLLAVMLAATFEGAAVFSKSREAVSQRLSQGQLPESLCTSSRIDLVYKGTKFSVDVSQSGASKMFLSINGSRVETSFRHIATNKDGGFLVSGGFDGKTRLVYHKAEPQGSSISFDGATYTFLKENDPTQVRAPLSGKLVRWLVDDGSFCEAGTAYCELEIMKMYMQLKLDNAGTISHVLSEGAVFNSGDLLATLELPHGAQPPKITPFTGTFPPTSAASTPSSVLAISRCAEERIMATLRGYEVPTSIVEESLKLFSHSLFDPTIAGLELRELLSILNSQMPEGLKKRLQELLAITLQTTPTDPQVSPLPVDDIRSAIEKQLSLQISPGYSGPTITQTQLEPLLLLIRRFQDGCLGHAIIELNSILSEFCTDEKIFQNATDGAFKALLTHRTELSTDRLTSLLLSHQGLKRRVFVVSRLLDFIKSTPVLLNSLPALQTSLKALASFATPEYNVVTVRARQLELLKTSQLQETLSARVESVRRVIMQAEGAVEALTSKNPRLASSLDALVAVTTDANEDANVRKGALEALIRVLYFCAGDISSLKIGAEGEIPESSFDENIYSGAAGSIESLLKSATPRCSNSAAFIRTPVVAAFNHAPFAIDIAADNKAVVNAALSSPALAPSSASVSAHSDSRLLQLLNDASDASGVDGLCGPSTTFMAVLPSTGDAITAQSILEAAKECMRLSTGSTSRHGISLVLLVSHSTLLEKTHVALSAASKALKVLNIASVSVASIESLSSVDETDLVPMTTPTWNHFKLLLDSVEHLSTYINIDPAACSKLEVSRLSPFVFSRVPTHNHFVSVFDCAPHSSSSSRRLFARVILRSSETDDNERFAEQERYVATAIHALESSLKALPPVASRAAANDKDGHHLLLHILPTPANKHFRYTPTAAEAAIRRIMVRYENRIMKLRITKIEVGYPWCSGANMTTPLRFFIDNPTGQAVRIRKCQEVINPSTSLRVLSPLDHAGSDHTDIDNIPVLVPHPVSSPLTHKRALAASVQTVYCYDFLALLDQAIRDRWRSAFAAASNLHNNFNAAGVSGAISANTSNTANIPSNIYTQQGGVISQPASVPFMPECVLDATELVMNARGILEEVVRPPGQNNVGMVAWCVRLFTPEFPKGRRMVLIANDCTFQMGTFGVQEDLVFQRASELARREGIPRIFMACNSGARMGIANEVLKAFKIEWVEPSDPAKGFRYIYLTADDYQKLAAVDAVVCEPIEHTTHGLIYKITDVIGAESGLGVENLCGSGAIAGETSRAYRETFTLTYVTGRNVGIGAYITRLGQRVIQKKTGAPILLTGYQALNRLVGRDVYSSNDEIGGVDVMFRNGVTHEVVDSDLEGCRSIINWLAYVPEKKGGALPVLVQPTDSPTRLIDYKVASNTADPRLMLTGAHDEEGNWQGGLLDRGSFSESLSEWAKSVIVGRGRLGGYPLGCIIVETRVTEAIQPADPAAPLTSETSTLRAGQVWYPDSAYKTAQAINDFNKEELPLMILANWRGFSGGQRDMFLEVLKFGSFIVDALVDFKQPCMVYIPPKGELRGGAWVVVDPRINPSSMEMFADCDSRGGVLEPTGTVEIKLRERQLAELAGRLDPKLMLLAEQDDSLVKNGVAADAPERVALKDAREKRLNDLMAVYKQVAMHFADLHDTSVRMKKKHAITCSVQWSKAREFFYWRLRRQLILFTLRAEVVKAAPSISAIRAERLVLQWAEQEFPLDAVTSSASTLDDDVTPSQNSTAASNNTNSQQKGTADESNELEAEMQRSIRVVKWAKASGPSIINRIQQLRVTYLQQQMSELQGQLDVLTGGVSVHAGSHHHHH